MKEQIILFRKVSIICALSILQLFAGCSANFELVEYTYELTLIDNEVMAIDNAIIFSGKAIPHHPASPIC